MQTRAAARGAEGNGGRAALRASRYTVTWPPAVPRCLFHTRTPPERSTPSSTSAAASRSGFSGRITTRRLTSSGGKFWTRFRSTPTSRSSNARRGSKHGSHGTPAPRLQGPSGASEAVPAFVEARVSNATETVLVQWPRDSAFRFFPLVEHETFGLTVRRTNRLPRRTYPRCLPRAASLSSTATLTVAAQAG